MLIVVVASEFETVVVLLVGLVVPLTVVSLGVAEQAAKVKIESVLPIRETISSCETSWVLFTNFCVSTAMIVWERGAGQV